MEESAVRRTPLWSGAQVAGRCVWAAARRNLCQAGNGPGPCPPRAVCGVRQQWLRATRGGRLNPSMNVWWGKSSSSSFPVRDRAPPRQNGEGQTHVQKAEFGVV